MGLVLILYRIPDSWQKLIIHKSDRVETESSAVEDLECCALIYVFLLSLIYFIECFVSFSA